MEQEVNMKTTCIAIQSSEKAGQRTLSKSFIRKVGFICLEVKPHMLN